MDKIKDVMTHDVAVAAPRDLLTFAAQIMADRDVGCLPVVENERVVGIITDRDLVTRAVAQDAINGRRVNEIMSAPAVVCTVTDNIDTVMAIMANQQLRRIPAVDDEGKLRGIVSLTDGAKRVDNAATTKVLGKVVARGGRHNQAAYHRTTFGR